MPVDPAQVKGYLSLIVGDHPTYEDGDIFAACNWRRCRHIGAEGICHARVNGKKLGGQLSESAPLLQLWYEQTHQYRFERISHTEMRRIDLWTHVEEVLSGKPNEKGESTDVPQYLSRRLESGKLPLFGLEGAEVWYGGRKNVSHDALDVIWATIEKQTPRREVEFARSPFGDHRKYLVLAVNDFTDEEWGELESPMIDDSDPENPVTVKKRKHQVAWRVLAGVVEADVLNRKKELHLEEVQKFDRTTIVRAKTVDTV